MRKLFSLTLAFTCLFACTAPVTAQVIKPEKAVKSPDTSVNTATVIQEFKAIPAHIKAFQATVTRISGTVAGGVTLQGSVDGVNWVTIGTNDTLIATGTLATKIWPITATSYYSYRALYRSSGTQTSTITFSYLRRPDE